MSIQRVGLHPALFMAYVHMRLSPRVEQQTLITMRSTRRHPPRQGSGRQAAPGSAVQLPEDSLRAHQRTTTLVKIETIRTAAMKQCQ